MSPPITDPPSFDPPENAAIKLAGILLAAGAGTRFKCGNKLLVPIDGEPVVRQATTTLTAANLDSITVVLGHERARIKQTIADLPVSFVTNQSYTNGLSTSVSRGLSAIPPDSDAVVIALADMPYVKPATIHALHQSYLSGYGTALAASYNGSRGNPVLFDQTYFNMLHTVSGDTGGRDILETNGKLINTNDSGVLYDIDTVEDLP